ncbi:YlxR family protein [Corynebacterium pseudotuberculosis]|uniref:DUF448 domain-containing protein n=1 Tax=Corynebacterium pseudotuberculosis (strain C231) TaxID=681645 RepID=D9QB25_CORP2|nr:YlxR family protein [Corynebacterium pseudotuberculosis]AER69323.1 putative nucleic-acid-binding protein implicated in transcription termination [Corynebacterium pseudotuberculosis 1/06-A]ADK29075.1 DUF448 domain-containing protein [Corynebacterium pseudotuberculosis FRC41]ADL10751.1 DUF448 domain-containing protein [Corynebacterium pseudotuberculosis C231]ADL21159.1 YlxR family protein [Corynebacterium pseudotuberculosis 1002]ADO26551.1 DUF448 domain-containing protein [Corynebacterium pse
MPAALYDDSSRGDLSKPTRTRIRTCIATKKAQPADQLLRVVARKKDKAVGDSHHSVYLVIADPCKRLKGRGAWITPTIDALELAEKRRAFARALRVSAEVDTGHVREYLAALSAGPDITRKTEH